MAEVYKLTTRKIGDKDYAHSLTCNGRNIELSNSLTNIIELSDSLAKSLDEIKLDHIKYIKKFPQIKTLEARITI